MSTIDAAASAVHVLIWLVAVAALVLGLCGYSKRKWWRGHGHGSFEWWQASRRRNGWWW